MGNRIPLQLQDFQIIPLESWESPKSKGIYPIRWKLNIPKKQIELMVQPVLKEQELMTPESTQVTYWEGVVSITGNWKGKSVTGKGYTELTGYAKKRDKK